MPTTCAPAVISRGSNLPSAVIDGIQTRYEVRGNTLRLYSNDMPILAFEAR